MKKKKLYLYFNEKVGRAAPDATCLAHIKNHKLR